MLNWTILSSLVICIGILSIGESFHQLNASLEAIANPSDFNAKWIKVK